jgi:glycosyltransferase involved in cell wall biosynthesis
MVEKTDNGSLRVLSTEGSGAGASLSVVIPLFNEESNVADLYQQLCGQLGSDAEIVFVDDGSTDGTFKCLTEVASADSRVRIVRFRRNFGQTAALSAGIDRSRGDIIVPMDGDLQNDPSDIPRLLDKLDEGYDVVSGWRMDRKDPWARRIPSRIANWVISVVSGVQLHDYGCSLKAYRRSVLADVRLYGEMHRFVPIYATWQGARVAELPVTHHPRSRGRSHYGFDRTAKVILDLIVVKFLESYATKPIYVFGGFGLLSLFAGFVVGAATLYLKFSGIRDLVETPLPLLTVLLILVGILSVLLGLVAELTVRTYYESQDKKTYVVWEAEGAE